MKIDHRLNLVLPVDTHLGEIYVHSTPVGYPVFEKYFKVMSRTWASLVTLGAPLSGPKVPMMELRDFSQASGIWDGPQGVRMGLVEEMRRLTSVIVPRGEGGWEAMMLMDAHRAEIINDEDLAEIEGAVCFFTLAAHVQHRRSHATTFGGLGMLWGAQITSLTSSEYLNSLSTSTGAETTSPTPTERPTGELDLAGPAAPALTPSQPAF